VLIGQDVGKRIELDRNEMTVGRAPEADLTLDDERVSRIHCVVLRRGNEVWVEDRDSRNGTYVDGQRVNRCTLSPMANLQVGRTVLHLEFRDRARTQQEEELLRQAATDPLTGVLSRQHFVARAEACLAAARARHDTVVVALVDVDHFKQINDACGHLAGDHVLRATAAVVQAHTRGDTLLGRYGGDELILMLSGARNPAGAVAFGERLRRAVAEQRLAWEGRAIPVTVSVGLCHAPAESATGLNDLIARADKALYRAKDLGRNGTQCDPLPADERPPQP
jgi:two-component system, cell cycle response regulator